MASEISIYIRVFVASVCSFVLLQEARYASEAFTPSSKNSAKLLIPKLDSVSPFPSPLLIDNDFRYKSRTKKEPNIQEMSRGSAGNTKSNKGNSLTEISTREGIVNLSNMLISNNTSPDKVASNDIKISTKMTKMTGEDKCYFSKDKKVKPGNKIVSRRRPVKKLVSTSASNVNKSRPWEASYYISLKSQKLIEMASIRTSGSSPIKQASAVLETFLGIPAEKCNAANLIYALTLSAKIMNNETSDRFRSLLYRTTDILAFMLEEKKLSARQLCNAVWAIAKHSDRDAQLLPLYPTPTVLSDENVKGQAETWDLRYDVAGCPARRVDHTLDEIATQLAHLLTEDCWAAKEGELCMAGWAYGVLRRRRRPAGWQFAPQLGRVPVGGDSKSKGNIANQFSGDIIRFEQWDSTGKSGSKEEQSPKDFRSLSPTGVLFDKIADALCVPLHSALVTTCPDTTSNTCIHRVQSCKWSELANMAWAFASHGRSHTQSSYELLIAIACEASRRLQQNTIESKTVLSRDIAQIMWSLGTLQSDNFRLADSLVEFVDAVCSFTKIDTARENDRPLKDFSCADLVQIASSLARARLNEIPLLRFLYAEALYRMISTPSENIAKLQSSFRRSFLPWEITVLLWAQARLYLKFPEEETFNAFARNAVTLLNKAVTHQSSFDKVGLGAQELANIAWSLTVLELYFSDAMELLQSIFAEAASSCEKNGVIQIEHAHQLWQAFRLLEDEYPECVKTVPNWFRLYLEDKWQFEKSRLKVSSERHKSLSKTLNLMGVRHFNEHDEDIDVAIVLKPRANWTHETNKGEPVHTNDIKIAVEFDGPNHFTRQRIPIDGSKPAPPRALGHTVLKYRLLKKQGWVVVRVPFYEFDKIPFWASMERQRYLQRLLKTHCNIQFSMVDVSNYKPQNPARRSRYD